MKSDNTISIRLCCLVVGISEACYHYQPKLNDENDEIADWLIRLTQTHKRWGFGLCFDYLRTQGFTWNHKRVYRIYRELALNKRIKPRKRLKRDNPEYPPKVSLSDLVKRLKGRTSRILQQEFPHLQARYWGRHFGAIGYGAWLTGNITEELVQEYLEHHRTNSNADTGRMILE